jgi:predicted nucleic acid-binding protein
MKKLKLYLDTSVISYLDQQDAPEKMAETRLLWEKIKAGAYEVVLSEVDFLKLDDCDSKKRETLYNYLEQIPYTTVRTDSKAVKIAERFIDLGILKQNSIDDCRHIANAIVSGCDAIVSWNFQHIANPKTQKGVKAVTAQEGYNDLFIYTPTFLIGDNDDTL